VEKSPWWEFAKKKLADAKNLTMMPLPPEPDPAAALKDLGVGDLESLSKLDINDDRFIEVALRAGISPDRLAYFLAHANASTRNSILVTKTYEDPFKARGATEIVHVDFEDMLSRRLDSGVYLFGVELQNVKDAKPIEKKFIFAKSLEQNTIEDAWAEFLTYLKNHPRLRSGNYVITTYSKHELVKFEQEFDVLKQPAANFDAKEKKSPFYSEAKIGGKTIGRLIRKTEFFKNHPEVRPQDIFSAMDRIVDLLDFVRKNFAFPGYTNSIKQVLRHLGQDIYGTGLNGLESIAWAKEAYATGEETIFEKIRGYNEKDIDANRYVSDYVRQHAGETVAEPLRPRPKYEGLRKKLAEAVSLKRRITSLEQKRLLLHQILGRDLSSLKPKQLDELVEILDRSAYLEKRHETENSEKLSDDEVLAELQKEKFDLDETRIQRLFEFFGTINPGSISDETTPESQGLALLLSEPGNYLTPKHVQQILVLEQLEDVMDRAHASPAAKVRDQLEIPERLAAALSSARIDTELSKGEVGKLWKGLYYYRAFPSGDNKGVP
jgi:Txe/YoeB family toxin of Txe-Axe toxin-antitoxin module